MKGIVFVLLAMVLTALAALSDTNGRPATQLASQSTMYVPCSTPDNCWSQ